MREGVPLETSFAAEAPHEEVDPPADALEFGCPVSRPVLAEHRLSQNGQDHKYEKDGRILVGLRGDISVESGVGTQDIGDVADETRRGMGFVDLRQTGKMNSFRSERTVDVQRVGKKVVIEQRRRYPVELAAQAQSRDIKVTEDREVAIDMRLHDGLEDFRLPGKAGIDRPFRYMRGGGDLLDGGPLEPLGEEKFAGGVDNPISHLFGFGKTGSSAGSDFRLPFHAHRLQSLRTDAGSAANSTYSFPFIPGTSKWIGPGRVMFPQCRGLNMHQ